MTSTDKISVMSEDYENSQPESETQIEPQLDAASATRLATIRYVDQQLRAAEHHYLMNDFSEFALGYLEGLQHIYSTFVDWHRTATQTKFVETL